jgi:hypothetical protein
VALLLAGDKVSALEMLVVSVVLFFLILWATHCANEAVGRLESDRQGRS